jgi:hypothetical protein
MQNVREAKDRRMKKIAIGGGVLLVALLAFEIPHFMGGKKSAAPPATTTVAGATTTPGTTAPATSAPTTPAVGAPTASAKLTSSDLPPRSTKGQLASFSTFDSKDPFVSQIPTEAAPCTCSGSGSGSGSASAPASGTSPASSAPVVTSTRTLAHSGAVMLMVNGKRESVRVGASFPSSNPIFRLVAVTRGAVRIGIANGSYASGAQTLLLRPNKTITLVDTSTHARYKLQLLLGS